MKNLSLIGAVGLAFAIIGGMAEAQLKIHKDNDWNTSFAESCGYPSDTSVQRITIAGDEKIKFTLNAGDVGKCSTDNRARHRAPFWERAEISQETSFRAGHRYTISAEITFLKGFTGQRETFFQIHGWARNCKKAYPPVMMKFTDGRLRVETLRGVSPLSSGRHRNALKPTITIQSLYGRPIPLEMDFDIRTRPARLSVKLGGTEILSDAPVGIADCAVPHLKFGIYRPGGKGSGTSSVTYDDVMVRKVE